jgi:hypothetical protein
VSTHLVASSLSSLYLEEEENMGQIAEDSLTAVKYSLSPAHEQKKALADTLLDQGNNIAIPARLDDKELSTTSPSNTILAATSSRSTHSDGPSTTGKTLSLTSSEGDTSSIRDYLFTGGLVCPLDDKSSIHDYLLTSALEPIEDVLRDILDELREQRSCSEQLKMLSAVLRVDHLQTEETAVTSEPALALLTQPALRKPGEEGSAVYSHSNMARGGRELSACCAVAMSRMSFSWWSTLSIPSVEGAGKVSRRVAVAATFWLALAKAVRCLHSWLMTAAKSLA